MGIKTYISNETHKVDLLKIYREVLCPFIKITFARLQNTILKLGNF